MCLPMCRVKMVGITRQKKSRTKSERAVGRKTERERERRKLKKVGEIDK